MFRRIALPLAVVLMLGCAVAYYATYDADTDTRLTKLQGKTEFFYQTAIAEFDKGGIAEQAIESFYDEAQEEVGYLSNKADGYLNNRESIHQYELLRESFNLAEQLHLEGFKSTAEIELIASSLDSHFRALLALERAKERR